MPDQRHISDACRVIDLHRGEILRKADDTSGLRAAAYSYRSASIGSSLDARMAGTMPKKTPMVAENPIPIANDHHGRDTGKFVARWTARPIELPTRMPKRPPAEV